MRMLVLLAAVAAVSIFSLKNEPGGGSEATPPLGSPFRLDFDLRGRPTGGGLRLPVAFVFPS